MEDGGKEKEVWLAPESHASWNRIGCSILPSTARTAPALAVLADRGQGEGRGGGGQAGGEKGRGGWGERIRAGEIKEGVEKGEGGREGERGRENNEQEEGGAVLSSALSQLNCLKGRLYKQVN